MEQNKSNTGIKFEVVVLWGSGSQSYCRSLSVTVIPWGVTLKLTVVNFLAASSVDKRSTVRCIALAPVSISTSRCPRYISQPTVSRKKKQISALKLLPRFASKFLIKRGGPWCSSARNVPGYEERGETDVFAGYGKGNRCVLGLCKIDLFAIRWLAAAQSLN